MGYVDARRRHPPSYTRDDQEDLRKRHGQTGEAFAHRKVFTYCNNNNNHNNHVAQQHRRYRRAPVSLAPRKEA